MKKNKNSDKKKILIKKSSESVKKIKKLTLNFNQVIL